MKWSLQKTPLMSRYITLLFTFFCFYIYHKISIHLKKQKWYSPRSRRGIQSGFGRLAHCSNLSLQVKDIYRHLHFPGISSSLNETEKIPHQQWYMVTLITLIYHGHNHLFVLPARSWAKAKVLACWPLATETCRWYMENEPLWGRWAITRSWMAYCRSIDLW